LLRINIHKQLILDVIRMMRQKKYRNKMTLSTADTRACFLQSQFSRHILRWRHFSAG